MKLSTRLLLTLLPTVAAVMLLYALWGMHQRERALTRLAESETRAYAAAVGVAFENAFQDLDFEDVQDLLDEVSREPRVHGILIYGADGSARVMSEGMDPRDAAPQDTVGRAIEEGRSLEFHRSVGAEEVYSVVLPLPDRTGRVTGALEVTQPLSFVEAEVTRTVQRFLLNTLTLLLVVAAAGMWLVRRFVARPLERLVDASRALGSGNLSRRVPEERSGSELEELAHEFNRMARRLEEARAALLQETEERVLVEQRVRETEKLAAVGTLAAGVAHQIASPLGVIGGRARLLLARDSTDPVERRNLEVIESEIERITRIVRNLLDFSRMPEPRVRRVELLEVVRHVRELLEGELEQADIELALEAPGSSWVRGDPDLLQELLVILLMNAIQALQTSPGVRRIELGATHAEDVVEVAVADTGPGIPEEDVDRVFDPFFSTKAGGTGLGLAVAKNIVEQLGGRLTVETRAEAGALFRFTLPAAAESRERAHV